jgi:hypothetical protein
LPSHRRIFYDTFDKELTDDDDDDDDDRGNEPTGQHFEDRSSMAY